MTTCSTCGNGLEYEDRFCRRCAAPVPPGPADGRRPPGRGPVVAGVVAVVVALLAGATAVAWSLRPAGGAGTSPTAEGVASGPPPPAVASTPAGRPIPPTGDPTSALAAQAAADRPTAEASVGYWLPQISSRAAGLQVGDVLYDDARILAELQEAQRRHGAILVRSDDFSTSKRSGYWVFLVPQRFTVPQAANSWCVAAGFEPEDRFAKRLSRTDGPDGNTLHWSR